MDSERCEACRFYYHVTPSSLDRLCRRHAPIRDPERDRENGWCQTVWPIVMYDDWCGDFEAKPNGRSK